uniref:RRM domain-containing protein n=1 Tax=Anopheles atroparvus TaxID=41427 RepID=A0A182ITA3_ANOAO
MEKTTTGATTPAPVDAETGLKRRSESVERKVRLFRNPPATARLLKLLPTGDENSLQLLVTLWSKTRWKNRKKKTKKRHQERILELDPAHQRTMKLAQPMVTRTKKIFVGGLSAPTTLEDVKSYFEQFGPANS